MLSPAGKVRSMRRRERRLHSLGVVADSEDLPSKEFDPFIYSSTGSKRRILRNLRFLH